ncbi:MAG: anthranilate synthase component II [Cyclobacteriaceae bacterium]
MKLLVLDNYDSFTYNLVHMVRELEPSLDMEVRRNDKISLDEVKDFAKILLSPGPGIPSEAGIMPELIREYAPSKDLLGICLGHQAIAEAFGATLFNMTKVKHGIASTINITKRDEPIFKHVPTEIVGGRYHSWLVEPKSLNGSLEITARDQEGNIMGLSHRDLKVKGLQFHPESVLTEHGKVIIKNWITS